MGKRTDGKKIASSFVKGCLSAGIPLSEAYLFGSWAKGYQKDYSDIDIALVGDSFGKNIIDNAKQTALVNFDFPEVEVHHFSSAEFRSDDPFVMEIKSTGLKIY